MRVPQKQPKRGRLWLGDGACIGLRPERPNHVWSYDFVESRAVAIVACTDGAPMATGRKFRMLNVVDEFTGDCLAIRIDRKLNSPAVVDVLTDLFILGGVPGHVRSDNGPELIAKAVRDWIDAVGAKTAFVDPGSPWENGCCESFDARFRNVLLDGEIFHMLRKARILIERWRRHYNTVRPRSTLGYRRPAPESIVSIDRRPTMHQQLALSTHMGQLSFLQGLSTSSVEGVGRSK